MALDYTKEPSVDKWIFSENNNILEFTDDLVSRKARSAELTIDGTVYTFAPDPDGKFWINLGSYLSILLKDYDDDINPLSIDGGDISTFVFDWSKTHLETTIDLLVKFDDETEESKSYDINLLLGLEQVRDVFRQKTVKDKDITILSGLMGDELGTQTKITYYIKFWDGYPLDIPYTKSVSNSDEIINLTNETNLISTPNFPSNGTSNRIFLSSGKTTQTIELHMPLVKGVNIVKLNDDNKVYLEKVDNCQGTYVKWLNQYGAYNYWLFDNTSTGQQTKGLGNLNNDFSNVEDSVSVRSSLGRESQESIQCVYELLSDKEIDLLKGIAESPKVYLYTGRKYDPNPNGRNWIEVTLRNQNTVSREFKKRMPFGRITLQLPDRYTIKL